MIPRLAAPLLLAVLGAAPALAGTEEFSTFTVFAQEEDDESLLDHLLTRPPHGWRDEWEGAAQALRSSQGCLTSGHWFVDTRLKLRTPLGGRARFGLDVRQEESDRAAYRYFDFSFRFPTRAGVAGFWFRPLYEKSGQDLALFWEASEETAATQARLTLAFEDAFNNLWAFRQDQVGEDHEPYERNPFEPAAWFLVRRLGWRAELGGQWLTPSRKRLAPDPMTGEEPRMSLWGALGFVSLEAEIAGLRWELGGTQRQAKSGRSLAGTARFGGDYRRQWAVEAAARRAFGARLETEARWIYHERFERSDPPFTTRTLGVVDRAIQLEARYQRPRWGARVGGVVDRVTVGLMGDVRSHGSRTESRGYVGISARFGRVSVHAVEGIELDREPYEVWWAHDKAFVHLQTTF